MDYYKNTAKLGLLKNKADSLKEDSMSLIKRLVPNIVTAEGIANLSDDDLKITRDSVKLLNDTLKLSDDLFEVALSQQKQLDRLEEKIDKLLEASKK